MLCVCGGVVMFSSKFQSCLLYLLHLFDLLQTAAMYWYVNVLLKLYSFIYFANTQLFFVGFANIVYLKVSLAEYFYPTFECSYYSIFPNSK